MKDVSQELGGYSALLEMSSNPGMQVFGKRLGELADQLTKEQQAPRCWCLGPDGKSLCVHGEPVVNPAPTPEALLVKDMADWWEKNCHTADTRDLCKFVMRAYDIAQS